MSLELIKKPITLDEMTKKESMQVIKERDLIVPDGKPDMDTVISLDGKIIIDQIDISQDRVMYRGNIDVAILYRAEGEPKKIYTMKGNIPVEDFMILEGVNKDQKVNFDYEIEHMSYNILNERKINVKAIMQVETSATRCKEAMVITDIKTDEPVQTQEERIEIVSLGESKEEKVMVKEDLTIASNKPCVGEIIKTRLQIQEEQVRRMDSEVRFNGMIDVATMYKAGGDEERIEVVTHRVPFEGSIENVKVEDDGFWSCNLSAEPSYMQVTPDYDGEDRIIECEFIVTAHYNTFERDSFDTISDIYCPGKCVEAKEKTLNYMSLIDQVQLSIPKKEAIGMEETDAEQVDVFSIEVRPTVEEKLINDNKLTLKGILEIKATILYQGPEYNSIDTSINIVPFSQDLDINSLPAKAYIVPTVKARDVNIYAQTKRDLVIEYLLDCKAEIYAQNMLNVLEEISIEDMTKEAMDAYPSMTVYQVKKGDSLWGLAKRFNTTVKEIGELNDISSPEGLKEGQKIIILKKVRF